MNKNLRKAMISAICMLIVGVMSLTGVTYAWFTSSSSATVSGMTFDVYAPVGGVLISDTFNTDWSYELQLSGAGVNFTDFQPVSTAPSTLSGGALQFFTATVNTTPGDLGALHNVIYTQAVGSEAYFAKTLYLYNDSVEDIAVNLGGTTIGFNTLGNAENNNNAEYAMRLALVKHGEYDQTAVTVAPSGGRDGVVVYEPHATNHIDGTVSGQQAYNGIKGASGTDNWFDASVEGTFCEAVTTVLDTTAPEMTVEIPAGKCYAVTVYIWLEGQDVDCRNAIGGSQLAANLSFTLASTEPETEVETDPVEP